MPVFFPKSEGIRSFLAEGFFTVKKIEDVV
jgi:hypothetical protein